MSDWAKVTHTVDTLIAKGDSEGALRALGKAQNDFREDPEFYLIQGDVLWMVGDLKEGLASYERALSLKPESIESRCLVALALFELLEFERARETAASALEDADPEEPRRGDLYDLLSRLAEREGAYRDSDRLASVAVTSDPETFVQPCRLTESEFQEVADEAVEILPEEFLRALRENLAIVIEPVPSTELLAEDDPPLSPTILGLYAGTPLPERQSSTSPPSLPDVIYLFQRNIEREASDPDEITFQIATTVYHEIGHYFGMEEEDLEELDLS